MPIVTAHCRVVDGLGNPEQRPQVFLKVRGKFYRTHIHLDEVNKCYGGWCQSTVHYRGYLSKGAKEELRKLAQSMLETDHSPFALDPTGLKHCGIRFVF